MKLALAAVLLSLSCAARADDFFGITPEEGQALAAQAQAQQHEEKLRALGWEQNPIAGVDHALGLRVKPSSPQNCIYDAVAGRLGANPSADVLYPDVLYAVDVDLSRYQAAYKAEFPGKPVPPSVRTVYMPGYDVIYLDDWAPDYTNGATIDDALAAQYARFIDGVVLGVDDPARVDSDAAAVQSWYRAQFPAGASSCGN